MKIGIHGHSDPHEVARLPGILALPFKGHVHDYVIHWHQWRASGDDNEQSVVRPAPADLLLALISPGSRPSLHEPRLHGCRSVRET